MAKKDLETLRQETWEARYRLHVAVEINKTPLQEALKEVLPDSKTRKRTFETWKAKGLWPCSPDEVMKMSERFAAQWTGQPAEDHQPELSVEIFPNPTPDQARNLVNQDGEARYLIDSVTEKVYFWTAEHSHNKVRKILKEREDTKDVGTDLAITGVATLREDRFHVDRIYEPEAYATASKFQNPDAARFFEMDWSWAYQWLVGLEENFVMNREKFKGATIDPNIPSAPNNVTQSEPTATHPVSVVPDQATPLLKFGFTQDQPYVTHPQVTDEVEFDFSDSESKAFVTEPATPECAVPPQEHTEEVEPEPAVVTHINNATHEVADATQRPEFASDIPAQPSLTQLQREEIEGMIREMVEKEVQKAISAISPTLPRGEKQDVEVRPLFRRDETVTRSIRISRLMAEMAEAKAKQERVKTGGNLNALIEVLIWEYLGRPDELIENES